MPYDKIHDVSTMDKLGQVSFARLLCLNIRSNEHFFAFPGLLTSITPILKMDFQQLVRSEIIFRLSFKSG